jgi:hypothetical protein
MQDLQLSHRINPVCGKRRLNRAGFATIAVTGRKKPSDLSVGGLLAFIQSGRQDTVRTFSGLHPGLGCEVAAALPNQQVQMWLVVATQFPWENQAIAKRLLEILTAAGKAILGPQWATAID